MKLPKPSILVILIVALAAILRITFALGIPFKYRPAKSVILIFGKEISECRDIIEGPRLVERRTFEDV